MIESLATLISVGKRAYRENDLVQAERRLVEAVEAGADFADIHYLLGTIYHHWGSTEKAISHFERSATVNPNYSEALLALAIALSDAGRYEDARGAYRRAREALEADGDPLHGNFVRGRIARLHVELGELYRAAGLQDEAIREFRNAIGVAPRYPDLRVRLAVSLREAGRHEEGLAETERALSERPGLVPALRQKGFLLYLLGRKEEARRAWEEAMYRDPLDRLVQLYLNALDREPSGG